jgi:hypothetical protein
MSSHMGKAGKVAGMRGRLRTAVMAVVALLASQPPLFLLAFTGLAAMTTIYQVRYPISSGMDFHYHLMTAAMNARSHAEPVRALYRSINPLDANTLIYTVAYPFEKLTNPIRAFQIACTILFYVGHPFGCAYALVRSGRSPWGSLLAFPLLFGLTSFAGGYWPFLVGTAFIAPALAEMRVMHLTSGRAARNAGIACAVLATLTFLSHAIVYGWLAFLLAFYTLVLMGQGFGLSGLGAPLHGLRRAFWIGVKSLGAITPSVLIAGRWYWSVIYGSASVTETLRLPPEPEPGMPDRLARTIGYLAPTTGESEYAFVAALGIVVLVALIAGERRREKGLPIFEIAFALTLLSFVLTPFWYHYESIAPRQFDLAMLALPCVLFPRVPRLRSFNGFAIALVVAFSFFRLRAVGDQLQRLNTEDFSGLRKISRECKNLIPKDGAIHMLAYANARGGVVPFRSAAAHQAHETLAAMCGLETPVYDTEVYPHNLLPLRYVRKMPAPVTFVDTHGWYKNPNVLASFDYVLIHGWTRPPQDEQAAREVATLVMREGDFELWRKNVFTPAPRP